MTTTTVIFPILQLPTQALRKALWILAPRDIINFALISESAKQAAESLNLKKKQIVIDVNETISVEVTDFKFGIYDPMEAMIVQWDYSKIGLRKLIDHALSVFHTDNPDWLTITHVDHDWEYILNALSGFTFSATDVRAFSYVSHFQKFINQFSTAALHFEVTLDTVRLNLWIHRNEVFLYKPCALSTLLSMNCTTIWLHEPNCVEDFNIFLRHWIHGSNEILQSLFGIARNVDNYYFDKLLKGMHYEENTAAEEVVNRPVGWIVERKRDIYNCFGIRATVALVGERVILRVWE